MHRQRLTETQNIRQLILPMYRAGRLIDGYSDKPFENVTVLVEKNRIVSIGKDLAVPANATFIDLGDKTVLPGFIDAHTHIMSLGGEDYGAELYKNSIPYRAICAVASARKALWRGFTSMRDVESEGTMYADVDLKRAIDGGNRPEPPALGLNSRITRGIRNEGWSNYPP